MMGTRFLCAAAIVTAMSIATTARADLLNLTPMNPDILSQNIFVDYDAGSQVFSADGFALTITPPAGVQENFDTPGAWSISAIIDNTGAWVSGSISVEGEWSGFGTTLLTGNLVDFGFQPGGGQLFEFIFEVTGGDLATEGLYGEPGALFGVILTATGANFTGDWNLDFSNSGDFFGGFADTFAIPAPGAGLLFLLAGCASRRRRRS